MGWYYRKSVGFGPFRMNLSKSGISYSFGVKGARINTGPRGTYVNLGANGIYYRKKVSSNRAFKSNDVNQPSEPQYIEHTITSGNINELTDSDSLEFIKELTEKCNKISYSKWFGTYPLILSLFFLLFYFSQTIRTEIETKPVIKARAGIKIRSNPDKSSYAIGSVAEGGELDLLDTTNKEWYKVSSAEGTGYVSRIYSIPQKKIVKQTDYSRMHESPGLFWSSISITLIGFLFLIKLLITKDQERLLIEIYYNMDDEVKELYETFGQHFSELMRSSKSWQYLNAERTTDYKHNAGAGQLITRIPIPRISPNRKPERFFKTNINIPNIKLRNTDLYFFPERLIIKRNNKFAAVFYKHLSIDCAYTRFIETDRVPRDSEVIDYTWKYLNKNGTPDKRYKENRRLPICLYSEYTIQSDTGVFEVITTSKKGAFDNFAKFVDTVGNFQKKIEVN